MLLLVELDHVKSGIPLSPEAGRNFIEQVIMPTIARAEQLLAEKKIVAGGPVAGHIALRLVVEVGSLAELDQLMYSLPLYPLAETKITPLIAFADRRASVQALAGRLFSS
jgi:muconolactone delta-isomerase